MNQVITELSHLGEQRSWKEARGLTYAKLHGSSTSLRHDLQEPLVFRWREICVEVLPKGGNHGCAGCSVRNPRLR
jgi:hypothetical protein